MSGKKARMENADSRVWRMNIARYITSGRYLKDPAGNPKPDRKTRSKGCLTMRVMELGIVKPELAGRLQLCYGVFSLGPDGRPLNTWEARNIRKVSLAVPMQTEAFPGIVLRWVLVNRRMLPAIQGVYGDIASRWGRDMQISTALANFVKCYCFGDGETPNLFWYGAAWQLSSKVHKEILRDVTKIFIKHGFSLQDGHDRIFEYW